MIFQSDVPSTSSKSQSWGFITTIIFHLLLFGLVLLVVLPAPEAKPQIETFVIKFGTDAPGGPFTEEGAANNNLPSSEDPSLDNESPTPSSNASEATPTESSPNAPALQSKNNQTNSQNNAEVNSQPTPERRMRRSGNRRNSNEQGGGTTGGIDPNSSSRGNPNGDPDGSLDGTLYNPKTPIAAKLKPLRNVVIAEGEETEDSNPKKVKVEVVVGCKDGKIKKVKRILEGNFGDIKYLREKLIGQKHFEAYPGNCTQDIPGYMEVTILKG